MTKVLRPRMAKRASKCAHCDGPATEAFTLQMCAEGRRRRGVKLCDACDVALNRLILAFIRTPDLDRVIDAYKKRER